MHQLQHRLRGYHATEALYGILDQIDKLNSDINLMIQNLYEAFPMYQNQ